MRHNTARAKLAAGKPISVIAPGYTSAGLVELVAYLGFDAVFIDCEHGPSGWEAVEDMVRAAELAGATPIVRVQANDPSTITRTISGEIFLRSTEAEVGTESRSFWGEPFESWSAGNLVGTPEQVCEKVQAYVDAGCGGFVPWCSDYPDDETLELFATEVVPEFR